MLVALSMSAAFTACPIEGARYALRTEPTVAARFMRVESGRDWPQGLALRLDIHGRREWFLPWNGGTDGRQNVSSTLDPTQPGWTPPNPDGGPRPLGDFEYIGVDATYLVLDSAPKRGGAAPAHFLLPHLDDALRHPSGDRARDSIPRQFFDLIECGHP
jgi:hypothetical protein